jgi:pentatricopeptide repeat protein
MLDVCMQLLEQRDAETAIRVGDVFALLIYFHMQAKDFARAHSLVESMRGRGIPVDPFVDAPSVRAIYTAVGKAYAPSPAGAAGGVEEEIAEA